MLAGGIRPVVTGAAATRCISMVKAAATPGLDCVTSVALGSGLDVFAVLARCIDAVVTG